MISNGSYANVSPRSAHVVMKATHTTVSLSAAKFPTSAVIKLSSTSSTIPATKNLKEITFSKTTRRTLPVTFSLQQTEQGNKFERKSSNFIFEWTKFEFSKNRNTFESLRSNFELSIKHASDISPFQLVPRGTLGPLMVPPC